MISFTVPGKPAPQPRMRGRIMGRGPKARVGMYTPAVGGEWREAVTKAAAEAMEGKEILEGPVYTTITIRIPRPQSHLRANGEVRETAPKAPINMRSGDVDNLAKAIMDRMNKVVWHDDAQVVILRVMKIYTTEEPGADVKAALLEQAGPA